VLPEYKVRDLPLAGRDITDLINTTAGVVGSNIAGAPTGFSMTTRDGIPVNQGRYNSGVFTQTFVSPDLVDEVRVIVAPADAEFGRGSGQVQMHTRSGTNEFQGSVFWSNRNSATDAATFANNFNGTGKNYLNRNQYGGRLGGPIIRNKTFFLLLIRRAANGSEVDRHANRHDANGATRHFPILPGRSERGIDGCCSHSRSDR
jgi:hypothetical protein